MKKTILSAINALICVLLITINTILACKYGLSNDALALICLAAFFALIYALGMIAPNGTARFLYKLGAKMLRNSDIKTAVEAEVIRTFKKGRVYLLIATNIMLALWSFSFLTR